MPYVRSAGSDRQVTKSAQADAGNGDREARRSDKAFLVQTDTRTLGLRIQSRFENRKLDFRIFGFRFVKTEVGPLGGKSCRGIDIQSCFMVGSDF
jgi:hypothetical protein